MNRMPVGILKVWPTGNLLESGKDDQGGEACPGRLFLL